jgi:hypothetical protein
MMMITMSVEQLVEWELTEEAEVLGENLIPLCSSQIIYYLSWNRTRAAAVRSWSHIRAYAAALEAAVLLARRSVSSKQGMG